MKYTIGDIAKQYHISSDALRYYEEKGLITPKRSKSGYRIFSDEDIWRINVIEDLRALEFPVERIRTYLSDGTLEATQNILGEELEIVNATLQKLQRIRTRIERSLEGIEHAKQLTLEEITIKEFPDRPAHLLRQPFSAEADMDKLMKVLTEDEKAPNIIGNTRMAAVFSPASDQPQLYSGAIMMRDDGDHLLPGGRYLSICYSGMWNSRLYARKLIDYAEANGLQLDDTFYDIVWIDIHTAIRLSDHISEVQVRIL